jgi:hypothetical protein
MSTKLLAEIQSAIKAPKSQYNSFGKYHYRNAEDILEAAKKVLLEYEAALLINDEVVEVGGRIYIKATATLHLPDGTYTATAFAREEESKKGMDGSQVTGAASSYARKYALNGLFAIDDTKDSDSTNQHEKGENATQMPIKTPLILACEAMGTANSLDEVKKIWSANKPFQTNDKFIKAKDNAKSRIEQLTAASGASS